MSELWARITPTGIEGRDLKRCKAILDLTPTADGVVNVVVDVKAQSVGYRRT